MVTQMQAAAANTALRFDDETARRLEAIYLHPDVVERRRRVRQALALRPGDRMLDVGCGPGFLTAEIAAEVGPSGWVCGIDVSPSSLALARARCGGEGVAAWADIREGDAVALPFPDASFDAVVATQVYEYVGDLPTALAELFRVLRPGGRAVIVDTAWDSLVWHAADRERAAAILSAWDEHLADPSLPRTLLPRLRRAGFAVGRPEAMTVLNLEWDGYSKGLAGLIAGFVAGRRGITRETADAWLADLGQLDDTDEYFFSLDQFLFVAKKREA
jgi:ubiquinone/menaquinone biosynthesis C-methylase UbiE